MLPTVDHSQRTEHANRGVDRVDPKTPPAEQGCFVLSLYSIRQICLLRLVRKRLQHRQRQVDSNASVSLLRAAEAASVHCRSRNPPRASLAAERLPTQAGNGGIHPRRSDSARCQPKIDRSQRRSKKNLCNQNCQLLIREESAIEARKRGCFCFFCCFLSPCQPLIHFSFRDVFVIVRGH